MEWTPRPLVEYLREQERHNVTVITVGSKYEVYVRSPASSHMQTLKQPFQTLAIKWEVNIFEKKSSCVFSSCVFIMRPSFLRLSLILCHCDRWMKMYYVYNIILIWCLCQQSSSRIHNEPGYRKRQFLSITTRHQRRGQRKMLELKEVKRKKKQEQTSNKQMNRLMRKERKRRKREKRKATSWKKRRGRKKNKKQEQTSNRKEKRKKKKEM